ncbi:MAG TPA: ATP-binding cassette domain-containing protein [Spirochaetia bacterium]|nr:ATP-binding cassette domain-containing protein [Spirochaetia bacterium]
MSPDLTIEASGLCFAFKNKLVIDSLSFSVGRDQFVTFLGPSGSGKTTLLNLIAGMYQPGSGTLSVQSQRNSFVFQNDTLLPWRNALSNVLLPFEVAGQPVTPQVREQAVHILDELGLFGSETAAPGELSGGMKKRVELARALVTKPDLLILDEPFSSLDIITREKLNILLRSIHRNTRSAVVMVTHSVEEACFLSDKIYVLSALPAQIINVRELGKNGDSPPDQYLLSVSERDAARDIRQEAKVLWTVTQEPPQEAGENGAGEFPPRSGRGGGFAAVIRRHLGGALIPLELAALYFIAVFLKTRLGIPDYIVPSPAGVLSRFFTTLWRGTILPDLGATVFESLSGFLIAFVLTLFLGYGIAKSRIASRLLMPYLIAFNTIPTIALAPFLVLWFGFGYTPRIVTSVIVIFFPMLINNISAIRFAEKSMSQLIAFFRPRGLRRFLYFELPASLPMIASGVKVSITLSVIGAVVGEFVSGSVGLGSLVNVAKGNFDTELMFVGLVWLVLLGLLYYAAATLLHRLAAGRLK